MHFHIKRYLVFNDQAFLPGKGLKDTKHLVHQLMQAENFFGHPPVLILVFYPVQNVCRKHLQLLRSVGPSPGWSPVAALHMISRSSLSGNGYKFQWSNNIMTDDRDEPCLNTVVFFKYFILILKLLVFSATCFSSFLSCI